MNIYVDIDGTICRTDGLSYEEAKPLPERIKKINDLYQGHRITYYTARGSETGKDWSSLTRRQLEEWGCKYHELKFGKPAFDLLIDDRVKNINDL